MRTRKARKGSRIGYKTNRANSAAFETGTAKNHPVNWGPQKAYAKFALLNKYAKIQISNRKRTHDRLMRKLAVSFHE